MTQVARTAVVPRVQQKPADGKSSLSLYALIERLFERRALDPPFPRHYYSNVWLFIFEPTKMTGIHHGS